MRGAHHALFRQFGVVSAGSLDELFEFANVLSRCRPPEAPGVAMISTTGGTKVLMADTAARCGLEVPPFDSGVQAALREVLPDYIAVTNPADPGQLFQRDTGVMSRALRAIDNDGGTGCIVVASTGVGIFAERFAARVAEFARTSRKPVLTIWPGGEVPEEVRPILQDSTVPFVPSIDQAFRAIRALVQSRDWRPAQESDLPFPESKARILKSDIFWKGVLDERESKELLTHFGIPVVKERTARSEDEVVEAATTIGYPMAMKVLSADIAHKSEAGGVILDLRNAEESRAGYREILGRVAIAHPGARVESILVQEMVTGGTEVILGITQVSGLGPVVLFGLGGVAAELFEDVTFRLPPFGREEAGRMIDEVRAARLIAGFRGAPSGDRPALVECIMNLQRFALTFREELLELDVNPLIVLEAGKGVVAVDSQAVFRLPPPGPVKAGESGATSG